MRRQAPLTSSSAALRFLLSPDLDGVGKKEERDKNVRFLLVFASVVSERRRGSNGGNGPLWEGAERLARGRANLHHLDGWMDGSRVRRGSHTVTGSVRRRTSGAVSLDDASKELLLCPGSSDAFCQTRAVEIS